MIVVDHHTVPAADTAHPALVARQSVSRRLDVPVPRHGVGRARVLRRRGGAHRAARARYLVRGTARPSPTCATCSISSRSARSRISSRWPRENRILTALGLRRLQSARAAGHRRAARRGGRRPRIARSTRAPSRGSSRRGSTRRAGSARPSRRSRCCSPMRNPRRARAQVLEAANTERRAIQDRVMTEALELLGDRDPGPGDRDRRRGLAGRRRRHRRGEARRSLPAPGVRHRHRPGDRHRPRLGAHRRRREPLRRAVRAPRRALDRFGGHAAAAGFTVQRESIAALREALGGACARLAAGSGPVATRPRRRRRGPARRRRRAARRGARRPRAVRSGQPGAAAGHAQRAGHRACAASAMART